MNTPVFRNLVLNKKTAVLSLIIVFVACSPYLFKVFTVRKHPPETKLTQEESICEAVYRYQFENNVSGQRKNAKIYFLSLGPLEKPRDPSNELISRFRDHKPPVKKVSQCTFSPTEGVRDKNTGEQGLIFGITKVKWISATNVEVEGGYYEAGLSSSGNIYLVVLKNNKWVVVADRMLWISQLLCDVTIV